MFILTEGHRSPEESIASHAGELGCHISLENFSKVLFISVILLSLPTLVT